MMRKLGGCSRALLIVVVLMAAAGSAQAYSGIEHAWLALKYVDCWASFDPAFHAALTAPAQSPSPEYYEAYMLKKYYLIGSMIPDVFTPDGMSAAKAVIDTLHADGRPWLLTGGLSIHDATAAQVCSTFTWHSEIPNNNLPALYDMACYARDHNFTPNAKALIYGAYLHVVMDLHAGLGQQATLFGTDFLAQPAEQLAAWDPLSNVEFQDNIFEPTYLAAADSTAWHTVSFFLYGLIHDWGNGFCSVTHDACFQFYAWTNVSGTSTAGWQDVDFAPLDTFVSTMNAFFDVDNLTRERLEAYLHGFSITWFMLAGHAVSEPDEAGGLYAHPGNQGTLPLF